MIPGLISLLLEVPALVGTIKKLGEIIVTEVEKRQKKQLMKEMDDAIGIAKKTKDTSKLENLFSPGKNP